MAKVRVIVEMTRRLEREVDIPKKELDSMLGDDVGETPTLDEMYRDVMDSKYADTEYDFAIFDDENDRWIAEFDD